MKSKIISLCAQVFFTVLAASNAQAGVPGFIDIDLQPTRQVCLLTLDSTGADNDIVTMGVPGDIIELNQCWLPGSETVNADGSVEFSCQEGAVAVDLLDIVGIDSCAFVPENR